MAFETAYSNMIQPKLQAPVLRIAVLGHLPNKLNQTFYAQYQDKAAMIYGHIRQAGASILQDEFVHSLYQPGSKLTLRFTSCLAEGADRLLLNPVLNEPNSEFAAILPFPQEEFEKDFAIGRSKSDPKKGSIDEFRRYLKLAEQSSIQGRVLSLKGSRTSQDQSYQKSTQTLISHSDLVIVLYNCKKHKGIGSDFGVSTAKRLKKPTIIIDSNNPENIYLKRYDQNNNHPLATSAYSIEGIEDVVNNLLGYSQIFDKKPATINHPKKPQTPEVIKKEIKHRLKRFQEEDHLAYNSENSPNFISSGPIKVKKRPLAFLSQLYGSFIRCVSLSKKNVQSKQTTNYAPDTSLTQGQDSHEFYSVFLSVDQLASHYASIHRSLFIAIYFLGAITLSSAALALFSTASLPNAIGLFVLLEFVCISMIIGLYRRDHKKDYHDRWVEYRNLAELIRPLSNMSIIGTQPAMSNFHREQAALSHDGLSHTGPSRVWVYIYFQTLIRAVGFSSQAITLDKLKAYQDFLVNHWIHNQISYQKVNSYQLEKTAEHLAKFSTVMALITLSIVGFELLFNSLSFNLPSQIMSTLGLLGALLPILGSAAFAIRSHAVFNISAQRSSTMLGRLERIRDEINAIDLKQESNELERMTIVLAKIMSRETADWVDIIEPLVTEPV